MLGFSLFGAEELARFAFLWVIWLGVSLAVKRGAVTVITFVADAGPRLVAALGADLRGDQPGGAAGLLLLALDPVRDRPVRQPTAPRRRSRMPWFYPVVSMAVGYYFITLHYAAAVAARRGAAGGRAERGRCAARGWRWSGRPRSGRWSGWSSTACWRSARRTLIALGVIFVALTLAGTPIVFMLSIVGIIAFLPSFLGLEFFPTARPAGPLLAPPSRRWA